MSRPTSYRHHVGSEPASNANIAIYLDTSNTMTKLGLASANPVRIDGRIWYTVQRPGLPGRTISTTTRPSSPRSTRRAGASPALGPWAPYTPGSRTNRRPNWDYGPGTTCAHGLPAELAPGSSSGTTATTWPARGHLDQPEHVQTQPESEPPPSPMRGREGTDGSMQRRTRVRTDQGKQSRTTSSTPTAPDTESGPDDTAPRIPARAPRADDPWQA